MTSKTHINSKNAMPVYTVELIYMQHGSSGLSVLNSRFAYITSCVYTMKLSKGRHFSLDPTL